MGPSPNRRRSGCGGVMGLFKKSVASPGGGDCGEEMTNDCGQQTAATELLDRLQTARVRAVRFACDDHKGLALDVRGLDPEADTKRREWLRGVLAGARCER